MNFRIMPKGNEELKVPVLLYRDTEDENSFPIVVVTAWIPEDDSEDAAETDYNEIYTFSNEESAKCFIKDYSAESAKAFVVRASANQ